jgi:hypothetical protein
MPRFVGIDWASQTHAVCVVDEQGAVVDRFEIHGRPYDPALHRTARELRIAVRRESG